MNNFHDISLGDTIRALETLKPQGNITSEIILNLLGFEQQDSQANLHDVTPPKKEDEIFPSTPPAKSESAVEPKPDVTKSQEQEFKSLNFHPLQPVAVDMHKQSTEWANVTSLAKPQSEGPAKTLPYNSLFVEHWTSYIIDASLATNSPNGPLDIPKIIESFSKHRPIEKIPRRPWPSLFKGVQVLIDIGESMEPFILDQEKLLEKIQYTFGKDSVFDLQFRGCPSRGAGSGPIWTWKGYDPPAVGTPVLILTDLGIGRISSNNEYGSHEEWKAFAQHLKKHSCPIVIFVPYPPGRWPNWNIRGIEIIQWDRKTTISVVKKIIGNTYKGRS